MAGPDPSPAAPTLAVALARVLALVGGVVVLGMACITVVSVTGRALSGVGFSPVPGDFELVELGCAVAVFCFLPWCQVTRAHVRVDLIGPFVPHAVYRWLGWLGDLVLTGMLGLLLTRLWEGFGERFPYGGEALRSAVGFGPPPFFAETTYELQLPLWIPYAVAVTGLALAFAVSLAMLLYSARPGARGSGAPL
ncbi:MAG: TRAP transporter small permease [Rhodobacteraceae bacterium]|nr:TRAP transporter small permease [Paracoccaceae bacterium]